MLCFGSGNGRMLVGPQLCLLGPFHMRLHRRELSHNSSKTVHCGTLHAQSACEGQRIEFTPLQHHHCLTVDVQWGGNVAELFAAAGGFALATLSCARGCKAVQGWGRCVFCGRCLALYSAPFIRQHQAWYGGGRGRMETVQRVERMQVGQAPPTH